MPDPDEPTPVDDVFVIGTRAVLGGPKSGGGGGAGNSGGINQNQIGEEPTGPPEGYTQEEADEENKRQKECAAQRFANELAKKSAKNSKEFFSLTWVQNGQTLTHEIRNGTGAEVHPSDINAARTEFGIAYLDVVSFNHNHPVNVYCASGGLQGQDEFRANRFPSEHDWNWATNAVLVDHVPAETFTLFVTDCEGVTRAFPYSGKDAFLDALRHKLPPPPPIDPDCSET